VSERFSGTTKIRNACPHNITVSRLNVINMYALEYKSETTVQHLSTWVFNKPQNNTKFQFIHLKKTQRYCSIQLQYSSSLRSSHSHTAPLISPRKRSHALTNSFLIRRRPVHPLTKISLHPLPTTLTSVIARNYTDPARSNYCHEGCSKVRLNRCEVKKLSVRWQRMVRRQEESQPPNIACNKPASDNGQCPTYSASSDKRELAKGILFSAPLKT
jgi:hypothetical protein